MRGWVIAAAVLLSLVLIGQIRVGVRAAYNAGGLFLWLRLGAVQLRVLPARKKEKKPKKSKPPKQDKRDKPKEDKPKLTAGGALDYARALLPIVLEAAGQFYHKLQMDVLRLELRAGAQDPADAAMLYGQASAALGALWYPLTQAFHVKDGLARVEPDFDGGGMTLSAQAALSIKLGQIAWLGLYFGLKSLKAFLSVKNHQKDKRRKAV